VIAVDSSAVMAVILAERDAHQICAVIAEAEGVMITTAAMMECSIYLQRHFGPDQDVTLDEFVRRFGFEIVTVDDTILRLARSAFGRYGKGMNHPAQLNFGDCFSYALAKTRDLPLLYKGNDFSHTDVISALEGAN
jgi:ribonuclease VapC